MTFMQYIENHFIEKKALINKLNITESDLVKYTQLGVIPTWTYHVTSKNMVNTKVFGRLEIKNGVLGKYYSNSVQQWFYNFQSQMNHYPADEVRELLQKKFIAQYCQTIINEDKLRQLFPVFFDAHGDLLSDKLKIKAEETWIDHLSGAYGLCVIKPSSVSAIIEKQIAVAHLNNITENGKKQEFSNEEQTDFLAAAAVFDKVAMPFFPVDYPLSSRKHLLDDIKVRLGNDKLIKGVKPKELRVN